MIPFAALVGLGLGALVNLVADSLPFSRSIERMHCHACGAPRSLRGWSAIIALIAGLWACSYCGVGRRLRVLVVEITALLGSLGLALYNPETRYFISTLLVCSIFLLIVVIDVEHRLIPHIITLPAGIIFFIIAGLSPDLTFARSLLGGGFAFLLFIGLYWLGGNFGRWMARRRGMDQDEIAFGFGDVTLATVIGLLLGFPGVIEALMRGILYAGIFSIAYIVYLSLRRRYSSFIPIPYGPFLILGALWVYFQGWTSLGRLVGM